MTMLLVCLGLYGLYRGAAKLCKAVASNPTGAMQWITVARAVLPR